MKPWIAMGSLWLMVMGLGLAHEAGDPNGDYYQSLQRPAPHVGSCCDGPQSAREMGTTPDCFPVQVYPGPKGWEFKYSDRPVWRDYTGLSVPGHTTGDYTPLETGTHGKDWWVVPDDVIPHREAPPDGTATACIHSGTLLCFNPPSGI